MCQYAKKTVEQIFGILLLKVLANSFKRLMRGLFAKVKINWDLVLEQH